VIRCGRVKGLLKSAAHFLVEAVEYRRAIQRDGANPVL
jgi:hypothetical protein